MAAAKREERAHTEGGEKKGLRLLLLAVTACVRVLLLYLAAFIDSI